MSHWVDGSSGLGRRPLALDYAALVEQGSFSSSLFLKGLKFMRFYEHFGMMVEELEDGQGKLTVYSLADRVKLWERMTPSVLKVCKIIFPNVFFVLDDPDQPGLENYYVVDVKTGTPVVEFTGISEGSHFVFNRHGLIYVKRQTAFAYSFFTNRYIQGLPVPVPLLSRATNAWKEGNEVFVMYDDVIKKVDFPELLDKDGNTTITHVFGFNRSVALIANGLIIFENLFLDFKQKYMLNLNIGDVPLCLYFYGNTAFILTQQGMVLEINSQGARRTCQVSMEDGDLGALKKVKNVLVIQIKNRLNPRTIYVSLTTMAVIRTSDFKARVSLQGHHFFRVGSELHLGEFLPADGSEFGSDRKRLRLKPGAKSKGAGKGAAVDVVEGAAQGDTES